MRSSFHQAPPSALVRQLARWLPDAPEAPRQDVAERLGQWLHVAESVQLHAALGAVSAAGRSRSATSAGSVDGDLADALRQELDRVRAVLARSIRTREPGHQPDAADLDIEFALYHQRLNDQQRRMEMSVDALRQHVRQQLARGTASQKQLAALDAAMETLFAGREQRLLNTLPAWLKSRFQALRQAAAAAGTPDDLRWLDAFADEFEQTLLAELDLRLQPVIGLIESMDP
ncbi:MAG: DUF3348 family protein [Burkholderiaceae bacterium]